MEEGLEPHDDDAEQRGDDHPGAPRPGVGRHPGHGEEADHAEDDDVDPERRPDRGGVGEHPDGTEQDDRERDQGAEKQTARVTDAVEQQGPERLVAADGQALQRGDGLGFAAGAVQAFSAGPAGADLLLFELR